VELSLPLNPEVPEKSDPIDLKQVANEPSQSPGTDEAINELKRMVHTAVLDINHEYMKLYSVLSDNEDKSSPRGKGQTTILSSHQMRDVREQKKEKFLVEFNTSGKYHALRDKLKKAVFRLAVEKYKKTVGPEGFKGADRAKFKAELYTYLNEQLKLTLNAAVEIERENLH